MDFAGFFIEIFATLEVNFNSLLCMGSQEPVLFQNDEVFPNETWHEVRSSDGLQSCVQPTRLSQNYGFGGHRS